jgi:hypothetical protein
MKGVFALVSLLMVVAVIGLLSKKQMSPLMPTGLPPEMTSEGSVPPASTNVPIQKMPDQYKKALDEAIQKPRAEEGTP